MLHRIAQEYNNMKLLFSRSALSDESSYPLMSCVKLKLLECMFFPLLADQRQSEKTIWFLV